MSGSGPAETLTGPVVQRSVGDIAVGGECSLVHGGLGDELEGDVTVTHPW